MDSILETIKKQLGILNDYKHFDQDIIVAINTAFFILNQIGVGPDEVFKIESNDETWDEFLTDNDIEIIKSYIYLRVRLLFDPPTNSYLIENINKQLSEFEFRMLVDGNRRHNWYKEETDG